MKRWNQQSTGNPYLFVDDEKQNPTDRLEYNKVFNQRFHTVSDPLLYGRTNKNNFLYFDEISAFSGHKEYFTVKTLPVSLSAGE